MTYIANGKQLLWEHRDTKARTHIADAADNEKAHFLAIMANAPKGEDGGPLVAFDYMGEADKTCSVIFGPQNVDAASFVKTLSLISELCEQLNISKKLLFRGKSCADVGRAQPQLHESLAVEFDPNNPGVGEHAGDIDILHGIVGVITEAGEMADLLLHRLNTGKFDRVNTLEECGDVQWYIVRQLRGIGATLDLMQRTNIDKLHGRHGEAFDVFRDANRNLSAERSKLEAAAMPLLEEAIMPELGNDAADGIGRVPRFEDSVGLHPSAVPPRVRNDPPLPPGVAPAPNVGTRKGPCGDVEGMDA